MKVDFRDRVRDLKILAKYYWTRLKMGVTELVFWRRCEFVRPLMVPNPFLGLPRNETCVFCKSGKKYKRCCLSRQPREMLEHQAEEARHFMKLGGYS